jgi:hypothetical protein
VSAVRHPKLGVVVDFANCVPGAQTRIVSDQRRMYLDEGRQPWAYYGPMVAAIRRALADPAPQLALELAVAKVEEPAKHAHFVELQKGFLRWREGFAGSLVPVGAGSWIGDDAIFDVHPQLGLRPAKGPKLAVQLYMKEPELRPDAAAVPLHMMRSVMDQVLPGGVPAILDVRRGKLLLPSRRRSDKRLDADVAGVVAHWAAIWRAIA